MRSGSRTRQRNGIVAGQRRIVRADDPLFSADVSSQPRRGFSAQGPRRCVGSSLILPPANLAPTFQSLTLFANCLGLGWRGFSKPRLFLRIRGARAILTIQLGID